MDSLKVVKRLIVCLLCMIPGVVSAQGQYDFCAVAPSGQMLYYRIVPDKACAVVTHPEKEWPYYAGNKPVGDLVVPDSVRHGDVVYRVVGVGENAFYRCDSLTGFSARGITYIGTQSFCGCTMLKTIEFPAGLLSVGEGAFAYCRGLARLELPPDVESIGISAFSMCEGLEEVGMTTRVERLCDATTFHGCPLMQDRKNRKIVSADGVEYAVWRR